jgi:hypothetical protein
MTKFKIDMRDFLRTGEFGPIRLGMTTNQVEHLLGKPQDWGGQLPLRPYYEPLDPGRSYNDFPIWIYDAMEFHFGYNGQLFLIYCDHLDLLKDKGDVFSLNRGVFEANPPTLEQVEQALKEEKIDYTQKKLEHFGKLVLASGVEISYEYDDACVYVISHYDESYIDSPDHSREDAT